MAAWQLFLALVMLTVSAVLAADCKDKDTGKRIAGNGETFTLPSSGPCITYHCNNGAYEPSSLKCTGKNGCHGPDETFVRTIKGKEWTCSCSISADKQVHYDCK